MSGEKNGFTTIAHICSAIAPAKRARLHRRASAGTECSQWKRPTSKAATVSVVTNERLAANLPGVAPLSDVRDRSVASPGSIASIVVNRKAENATRKFRRDGRPVVPAATNSRVEMESVRTAHRA